MKNQQISMDDILVEMSQFERKAIELPWFDKMWIGIAINKAGKELSDVKHIIHRHDSTCDWCDVIFYDGSKFETAKLSAKGYYKSMKIDHAYTKDGLGLNETVE